MNFLLGPQPVVAPPPQNAGLFRPVPVVPPAPQNADLFGLPPQNADLFDLPPQNVGLFGPPPQNVGLVGPPPQNVGPLGPQPVVAPPRRRIRRPRDPNKILRPKSAFMFLDGADPGTADGEPADEGPGTGSTRGGRVARHDAGAASALLGAVRPGQGALPEAEDVSDADGVDERFRFAKVLARALNVRFS